MTIRNNVKERRTELGLSAADLANLVGITRSHLYAVENMSASHVSFSLIQRLTTALKSGSVRNLFPGTMCPEISKQDLRAHKVMQRAMVIEATVEPDGESKPLKVGDRVRVRADDIHERAYVGDVLEVNEKMFVVSHPNGWKECFLWLDLNGAKVRKYVEGWKEGML